MRGYSIFPLVEMISASLPGTTLLQISGKDILDDRDEWNLVLDIRSDGPAPAISVWSVAQQDNGTLSPTIYY